MPFVCFSYSDIVDKSDDEIAEFIIRYLETVLNVNVKLTTISPVNFFQSTLEKDGFKHCDDPVYKSNCTLTFTLIVNENEHGHKCFNYSVNSTKSIKLLHRKYQDLCSDGSAIAYVCHKTLQIAMKLEIHSAGLLRLTE